MVSLEQFHDMSLEQQREMLARFQAARKTKLTLKVSDKGAVSVYGMGRWPVTLYASQWERLLASKDEIVAFIETNRDQLAVKE